MNLLLETHHTFIQVNEFGGGHGKEDSSGLGFGRGDGYGAGYGSGDGSEDGSGSGAEDMNEYEYVDCYQDHL